MKSFLLILIIFNIVNESFAQTDSYEYTLFEVDNCFDKYFDKLINSCDSSQNKLISGYTFNSRLINDRAVIIISPVSDLDVINSKSFYGIFKYKRVSFFCLGDSNLLNHFLTKKKILTLSGNIKNTDVYFDERNVIKEVLSFKGKEYFLIIESCFNIQKKNGFFRKLRKLRISL